ncbi:hypothetical protein GPALN_011646 [Globodera pallida]|nr:hypothetical protein GPALN_011646 [Globodera pallida]
MFVQIWAHFVVQTNAIMRPAAAGSPKAINGWGGKCVQMSHKLVSEWSQNGDRKSGMGGRSQQPRQIADFRRDKSLALVDRDKSLTFRRDKSPTLVDRDKSLTFRRDKSPTFGGQRDKSLTFRIDKSPTFGGQRKPDI